MKASTPRSLMFSAALALAGISASHAQDVVMQKDGQRREGVVTAVRADAIRLKVGPVETAIPLANVQSVEMAAPADYQAAIASWLNGNAAVTLAKLEPLVQKFKGLPTGWAERACSLLPEVYLAEGRTADADAALADFQKLYPGSAASSDLLLARLAISKKDFETARQKLLPIVEAAKKTMLPSGSEAVSHSQALVLMGRVQEASGEKSEALENYLLVATIFKNDPSSATQAAERASALEEEKIIVP